MQVIKNPFEMIWRNRFLLGNTTWVELKTLYAGSVLGVAWLIIGPLLLLSIYAVVYAFIFRVRPEQLSVGEYVLYVFAGLVPFLAFSGGLTQGALALVNNRLMLLSTVFPPDLIPLRQVIIGSVSLPVGLCILLVADTVFGKTSVYSLMTIPVIFLQIMFVAGISWVLSLLTLVLRDIQQILQYVTIVLLISTPIAYTPDMIPEKLRVLMYANPLYYFTTSFQYMLTYDRLPPLPILGMVVVISFVSFFGGYFAFQKAKARFYDYI